MTTDLAATLPHRTRPPFAAWVALARSEARLVARDTAGLLLPIGLPSLFMVMNGANADLHDPVLAGMTPFAAVIVPGTLVMIVAMLGIVNVPSYLASYRQHGILRRLAATPARPVMVLVAQVAVNVALGAIGVAIALALAIGAFGIDGPRGLGWAVVSFLVGTAALYASGLLVAAIARTANAALALGLVVFFATMAAGGGMMPAEQLPALIARIGELLPYGAALHALRDSWIGQTPSSLHLAALTIALVAGPVAASRVFRWQ